MTPAAEPRSDFLHLRREPETGIEAVTARFHAHAYDMHAHDEWLVGVTHAGLQDFFCRGRRHQSTSGRVILIEPGERHDGHSPLPGGFLYSMLYLPQPWLREAMGGRDGDIGFRETLATDRQLALAIAETSEAVLLGEPALLFDTARDRMAARLARHLGRPAREPETAVPPGIAERALDYIRVHHAENFGLDALAAAVGAPDRFQLARAFRARFDTSPHACLVEMRLASARALLKAGEAPAEAASACGFSDQSHLGRWFRRAYGLTPAAYCAGRTNVPDRTASES